MPPLERFVSSSLNGGSSHSASERGKSSDAACDLRAAQEGCTGSLMALVHFLSQQGVAESSVQELQYSIRSGTPEDDRRVLLKIQKYYLACLPTAQSEAAHSLLLGCWNTQYRLALLQYQAAYQQYQSMRFGAQLPAAMTPHHRPLTLSLAKIAADIEKALQLQIQRAEQVCACQKEIILCNRRYEQMKAQETIK
jgi:hypothetical protein